MYFSINRVPLLKPAPALIKKAIGYIAMVIGAAFLVKGLQMLSFMDPTAEDT
jgi:hypothetical protein